MAGKKKYKNISEVLGDIEPDQKIREEFNKRIESRKIIKQLISLRAVQGMSQKDVAEKLVCTQSRISKLENGSDSMAKLGDLQAYAEAIGHRICAAPVPIDMKPVDAVKCHAFALKKHMDDLAALAKTDKKIAEGVAIFFGECFSNVFRMMGDSAKQLPLRPDSSPYFKIEVREINGDEEQDSLDCAAKSSASCGLRRPDRRAIGATL